LSSPFLVPPFTPFTSREARFVKLYSHAPWCSDYLCRVGVRHVEHSLCSTLEAISSQPHKKRVPGRRSDPVPLSPVIRYSWVTKTRRPLGRALARPCASNPSSKFGWPLFVFERLSYRRIPAHPRAPPPPYAAAAEDKKDATAARPMARQASAGIVSEDELEELRHYDTWSASGSAVRIAITH
jgi:hypothetical protein